MLETYDPRGGLRPGFRSVESPPTPGTAHFYFADRADGLRPPRNTEELVVARV